MSSRSSAISDVKKSATRGVFSDCGTCTLSLTKTSMDYKEGSSVWKTDRFLAACCRITETSGLEYILTRKCPLPFQANSLLGSLYPRYFGYYDKALTVYTHTSDQHSVLHTQVIACSVREAIYVLDGLLNNHSILRPKEHFVDTHGYTDQLFGLCHLLGYSLMPRLNVSKQKLSKFDRAKSYGCLDAVISGTVDLLLIR